jgi:CubicO group peptidase (beta-lactamase class C family)
MKTYLPIIIFFISPHYGNSQVNVVNGQKNAAAITKKRSELVFEKVKTFPNNTQVSIAIITNGTAAFYGIQRKNDTVRTINNYQSVFEIGSITKVFTSALLADLVLAKRIGLNNAIQDLVVFPLKAGKKITLKQLANHTSGLPRLPSNLNLFLVDQQNPYKEYDEKQLIEYLTQHTVLTAEPGTKYEYSNLGAGLLGYILCKRERSGYDRLLKTRIFSKYKMRSSTTHKQEVANRLVKGLDDQGKPVPNWDMNALVAAGGILSTVQDLSKFVLAQFNTTNKELALTRQPTFSVSQTMDIGLGWHIIKTRSNDTWTWHNGGTGGYSSSIAFDVKNKNAVIILSNVSAFNPDMGNIDKLCFELMKTLTD